MRIFTHTFPKVLHSSNKFLSRSVPSCMNATRLVLPILAFLVALGIAIVATILPFIPEWSSFQVITVCLALAAGLATGIWLLREVWLQAGTRLTSGFKVVLFLSVGFLATVGYGVAGLFSIFMLHGGLFAPIYVRQFDFPAYQTTIYVYDSSFLDPEVSITVRRGKLPLMDDVGTFGNYEASGVELSQAGEWAVCELFKMHLPTGEVVLESRY
jgi:hypothetical protein